MLAACGPTGKPAPADLREQMDAADAICEAGDLEGACEAELRIWVDGPSRAPAETPTAVREAVLAR